MLPNIKLELLDKYSELLKLSFAGDAKFPSDLCDFLVDEFEFQAVVLFKVEKDRDLIVLGKSSDAKNIYLRGSKFNCSVCSNFDKNSDFAINSDSQCELQVSEFIIYEICVLFNINSFEQAFLKIAKKSPFNPSETDLLKKISGFVSSTLLIWLNTNKESIVLNESSISEILYNSPHYLRAPVNSLIGFTSILAEENLSASQLEYITNIKKNAQNILVTLNDINSLIKIGKNEVKIKNDKIKLRDFLSEIISLFKSKYSGIHNSISYTLEENIPEEIFTDEIILKTLLNNLLLISSALSKETNIVIKVQALSKFEIEFRVVNNGDILSNEEILKLLTPFGILDLDKSKSGYITGLKTKIIKSYAELLGGNFFLRPGANGNEFILKIKVSSSSKIEEALSQLPKPTTHNRILVVEDDYATSKLLSNYLNKWGYEPTIVNTAAQTLSLIDKQHYLAIILDIELPNDNSLELLREINVHPNTKNTPVIVCSVEPEQQKAYMMGAVEYFIKPINYNYLVEVLTSYKLRRNSNILCVDDDVPTLNLIKQAIETAGYNAIAEHISANVMELIRDKDLDLAIIDLDMPHPNGFELIKLIKSEKKFERLPIIIYTGKENYQEDLKNIDGLFEQLLDKRSSNIEDLAESINKIIHSYEEPPPPEEVEKKENVIKILLAEDYKHSQIIVTRLLKKNGFENVIVVENGEEALKYAEKEQFNLILMDMQMPIMNGFEATEKIRKLPNYKDTPIISLTAFAMKGDREKCLASGATDYIPKPIDSKEFIEKVKYYTNAE